MTESTEQVFFTKKHSRLANIASLAKIIGWIYLVVGLVNATAGIASDINFYLPIITDYFKTGDLFSLGIDQIDFIIKFITSLIYDFFNPITYWLILMTISVGLNMILETDLNYRGAAENEEETIEFSKPKTIHAIVTETARVFKKTFQKKSTNPVTEERPYLKFIEGEQPVFYKPRWVLQLDSWLEITAVITIIRHIILSIINIGGTHEFFLSFFRNSVNLDFMAWVLTIPFFLIDLGSTVLFVFFSMIALGAILNVLMEMEFNSRGVQD
jgi:hypothetical protein